MLAQAGTDLQIKPLGHLDWDPAKVPESLACVVSHLHDTATNAIDYYCGARGPKRRWATWLRMGAIGFGAVAAVLPLLSQIFIKDGKPSIQPGLAAVALAVVAAFVAADQFFGFSTAWMRFMTTELRIRDALEAFDLDWDMKQAQWALTGPTPEQTQEALAWAKKFAAGINALIQEETNAWINEFQTTLRRFDEQSKTSAAVSQLGAINVTIKNGALLVNGWELAVDDGTGRAYRGGNAALRELTPGTHTIKATGTLNSARVQAETAVAVSAGGIASAELTLQ